MLFAACNGRKRKRPHKQEREKKSSSNDSQMVAELIVKYIRKQSTKELRNNPVMHCAKHIKASTRLKVNVFCVIKAKLF